MQQRKRVPEFIAGKFGKHMVMDFMCKNNACMYLEPSVDKYIITVFSVITGTSQCFPVSPLRQN